MKQWKKIILFSAILVVLIVALVFASFYKSKQAAESAAVSPTPAIDPVVFAEEKDVSKITVENASGILEFSPGSVKTESGSEKLEWNLTSPTGLLYSKTTVSSKISYYTQISADTLVTDSSGNLSEYGLDKPQATVTILLKSGEKKKILYGNETVGGYSCYAMLEGSSRICTTSTGNADAALLKSMDFLDTAVLNGFTVAEAKELQFTRKKDNVSFTAKSNNNASSDGQTPATWQITSPIQSDANADGYTVLLDQLLKISAESFVEMAPQDLSKYGLNTPAYDFTLTGDGKKVHCILGGDAGNGSLYGYSDYIKAVFVIGTSSLTSIDKPFVELMNSFVYMASIWEVSAIDIKMENQTIHCDIKDDQEKKDASDFKVNGLDANVTSSSEDSYFRTYYQSLISIYVKGLDVAAKPAYQPTITIDYTMADKTKNIQLGFVQRDETTYYVFKDSKYQGYYVNRDDFYSEKKGDEGILPAYRILQNAIQNQVNGVYQ